MRSIYLSLLLLTGCGASPNDKPDVYLDKSELKSGFEFISEDSQSEQNDSFLNPGFLWAEKGEELFKEGDKACQSCHQIPTEDFKTAPLSYPKIVDGSLMNIEGRINNCRRTHQGKPPLTYESEDLLALTTYVKSLTRGQKIDYDVTDNLRPYFEDGKNYFYTRRGQLNLSCHQCHDLKWGQKMRGDTISQGHLNGFPAYRNDWQTLGSTHRRFEACDIGVRAEPHPLGSDGYIALEVYLMARGNGLTSETPALRR